MQMLQGERYLWRMPVYDQNAIFSIASAYNLSIPIAQTLYTRGFTQKEQIDRYLFTSFEHDVAHPSLLKDALKSVERIIRAIDNQEKILVFGDYDVDGITSSALMMICLLPLRAQVNFFLPNRVKDGYGISTSIVERAAHNGYTVIITVDNGITAFEPAQKAKECGVDLIITDHHRAHATVPDAYAIVNPNQHDCPYPYKSLAGVGVTFKLLSLLYERYGIPLPAKAYELLLLGTIADVVPLLEENRFWVRHGLHYINKVESVSLKVLKQNSKLEKSRISATDIGFCLTPQINALGRLQDARQGVQFLIGSDEQHVKQVGDILFELNQERKEIERAIFVQVEEEIKRGAINLERENCIVAASDTWQPGVIGLVASRLVGAYGKPTILLHRTHNNILKGSCRSIPEFNMFNALQASSDLLIQFGGHSVAAGLSLEYKNLPALKERLEQRIAEQLTPLDLKQKITIDAHLTLPDLNKKMVADLMHLEPFGNANNQPLFYVERVMLVQKPVLLKEAHVKCSLFADGVIKPVIFFNRPELFETLCAHMEYPLTVAGTITENHWNGRVSIEMVGTDVLIEKGDGKNP
jgi:single-stranded-DNA-specific exonuclease